MFYEITHGHSLSKGVRPFPSLRPCRLAMGLVIGLAVVSLVPAQSASARETARHQGAVKGVWLEPGDDVVLPT
jgi:hypothetical protein